MSDERKTPATSRSSFILCIAIVAITFLIMLAWSWFDWPDPIVDFGRELYVPWKIKQGQVLYRDIAYFNGPLSPYFNSLVMRVLGVSLRSIVIVNLILLAGLTAMVWWLWSLIANRLAATVACVVLLTVFCFIQLGGIGNYNFVTPYSHEITHGVILSFAAFCCVAAYVRKARLVWIACAGFILGLIFLTKPEVFVAAAAGIGAGVILASRCHARETAVFAASLLVAPLIAWALLCIAMPARDAFHGVLGGWNYLGDPRITGMLYYKKVFGSDQLGRNVIIMLACAGVYALWLALASLPAMLTRRRDSQAIVIVLVAWTIIALICFATVDLSVWQRSLRGMSLVMPILTVITSVDSVRRKSDAFRVVRAMICLFATVLLAKIFLNVTSYHYGFALAMPAALAAVAATLNWLPAVLRRYGASGELIIPAIIPAIGLFIVVHLHIFNLRYARKTMLVSHDADAFWADPSALPNDTRGRSVNLMLQQLQTLPANATLGCVPEGIMINYLSRRTNRTPYINLMPPEVLMYGQDRILAAFETNPPDYLVIIVHSDPAEYGYKSFAADYGRDIFEWMKQNYEPAPAPTTSSYPLLLWKKKP